MHTTGICICKHIIFFLLKEGSLYWLLLFIISIWYMLECLSYQKHIHDDVYYIVQDMYILHICTTFKIYVHAVLNFFILLRWNLKRMDVEQWYQTGYLNMLIVIFNFVLRFNPPIKPHYFRPIKDIVKKSNKSNYVSNLFYL